ENVVGRDDVMERRLNHFPWRRRNHKEREPIAINPAVQELDQGRNVGAQADAPAGFLEVLTPDASEYRVVANQVSELPSLLHEIAARESLDLVVEPRCAQEFAQ